METIQVFQFTLKACSSLFINWVILYYFTRYNRDDDNDKDDIHVYVCVRVCVRVCVYVCVCVCVCIHVFISISLSDFTYSVSDNDDSASE